MPLTNHIQTADFKLEKHTPVITLLSKPKAGEFFTVEVSVGKDISHPNTTEHFISWISLYYLPKGSKMITELGKVEFTAHGESLKGANNGPAHTDSSAVFKIKLDQKGSLMASSYCNLHGLWQSETLEVEV